MVDTNTSGLVQILLSEPEWHIDINLCRDLEVISVTFESPSTFKIPRTNRFQSPPKICIPMSQTHFKQNTKVKVYSSLQTHSSLWFGATLLSLPCSSDWPWTFNFLPQALFPIFFIKYSPISNGSHLPIWWYGPDTWTTSLTYSRIPQIHLQFLLVVLKPTAILDSRLSSSKNSHVMEVSIILK